jgi:tripartite-type tricarboxylate transporter receptor subunit TctC
VSISERRKSRAETPPALSKRTQRRPVGAGVLQGHPFRVNGTEFARRRFLHLTAGAAALPAISRGVTAQTYPSRPIKMIVPFAAGGLTDVVGRVVAERMAKSLGQPIIIENVTGADGSIGVGRAARARPDGYTIDVGNNGRIYSTALCISLTYDVLNDFAPIAPLVTSTFVLFARKTMPAKDLNELIAWLKANPNRASMGTGSTNARVVTAFLQKETGTQLTVVPYRGFTPSMQDLIAGQIDLLFEAPNGLSLVQAGSVKAYAVTSDTRLTLAPDIPIVGELGLPALSFPNWFGLFAPRRTPRDMIGKLKAATVEALADRAVQSRLADLGADIFPLERQTPEALAAMVKADAAKWWPIIKELGIKAE